MDFGPFFAQYWRDFKAFADKRDGTPILIDGGSLTIAAVVASARYRKPASISHSAIDGINASATVVKDSLANGMVIYGVNTGFGGSADTRTSAVEELQATLIDELHYGILSTGSHLNSMTDPVNCTSDFETSLPIDNADSMTSMPESWARASMIVRLNSLSSGASGVRVSTAEALATLISRGIIPHIPLRGSISASGDLSPLSYIAGAMQGKPSIRVWADDVHSSQRRRVTSAEQALREAKLQPAILGPKEGLALVNGTAVSAGVAAIALHEMYAQVALCQILTAMAVEALLGTDDSFNPFIAKVRPHPGQSDSANSIHRFLATSKLVYRNDGKEDMTLRQDRYSIRTASQWIGPVLEDLLLAHEQITVEINSVTDNPLINTKENTVIHGGNFQAKSVTSAVEKARLGIQTIGRMIFAQCTELINPVTSRGLPANLTADEPSESLVWKGTDLYIASLASELGFLANPVGSHVMTAEMGNQSLNSLALISTRYTMTALDVLTQMSALHLMALCQALDCRAQESLFHNKLSCQFKLLKNDLVAKLKSNGVKVDNDKIELDFAGIWTDVLRNIEQTKNMDSKPRITRAVSLLWPTLMRIVPDSTANVESVQSFVSELTKQGIATSENARAEYRAKPDATHLLSDAAKRMYRFVRHVLQVPYMGRAGCDVSKPKGAERNLDGFTTSEEMPATVGTYLTRIFESMRSGALYSAVAKCFEELPSKSYKRKREATGQDEEETDSCLQKRYGYK